MQISRLIVKNAIKSPSFSQMYIKKAFVLLLVESNKAFMAFICFVAYYILAPLITPRSELRMKLIT